MMVFVRGGGRGELRIDGHETRGSGKRCRRTSGVTREVVRR